MMLQSIPHELSMMFAKLFLRDLLDTYTTVFSAAEKVDFQSLEFLSQSEY